MPRQYLFCLFAAFLLLAGCRSDGTFFRPTWFHPGTVQQQRIRATIHDPYPDQDKGPPFEDGRPREYQNALPEPVRNRITQDRGW